MNHEYADFYIGLMSGTSLDGIDAALVDLSSSQHPKLIHAISTPFTGLIRAEIENLCQPDNDEINRMGAMDRRLGELFAKAVTDLLLQSGISSRQVRAIGSHGQTIRHHPDKNHRFTVQIGDPNTIACRTGITTVADFRRMDIAAGGQGAPLVPAFHDATLRNPQENRAVVNIGGMANVSVLARNRPVTGFDTGPGNVLMDSWIQQKLQQPYDKNGDWAASGHCNIALLDQLMTHPYIRLSPPKSTGREGFHLGWLAGVLDAFPEIDAADIQRTLLEFTAQSIVMGIAGIDVEFDRLLVCGGGSHNKLLFRRIAELLPDITVNSTSDFGIDADWLEAMAFAWLAKQRLCMKTGNVPDVTGATHACILGGIYQPPPSQEKSDRKR